MITIFSIPKPFLGKIATIQRNAIKSWTLLHPDCEVILFGDEEGTLGIVKEFDIRHEPEVLRNNRGTPFINSIFDQAQEIASNNILCYVNCDIILTSDFMEAVKHIVSWKRKPLLMVGERQEVDFDRTLDFNRPNWESYIHKDVRQCGKPGGLFALDYFVFFNKTLYYKCMPPFFIGRPSWDNWMIWRARSLGIPVIDASLDVTALHQNHDYSHHPEGEKGFRSGAEAKYNLKLAGWDRIYSLKDATHVIEKNHLKLALGDDYLEHRIKRFLFLVNTSLPIMNLFYRLLSRLLYTIYYLKKYLPNSLWRHFIYFITR
jgi:hypothetical protein